MKIELKASGFDKVLIFTGQYSKFLESARAYGLWNISGWLKGKIYDWIGTAGGGTWPDFHILTRTFTKSGGRWSRRRRFLARHNWNWLTQFVRSKIREKYAVVSFGKAKLSNKRSLERQARRVEAGHETRATPPMRRLMGATKTAKSRRHIPGKTFFPIRRTTASLKIEEHPIMRPVFREQQSNIPLEFENWYIRGLTRQAKES